MNQSARQLWSEEAEQAVLGSALLAPGLCGDLVAEGLQSEQFFVSAHRVIWGAMTQLADNGRPVDMVTVSDALSAANDLEAAGGIEYLATLSSGTPSSANANAYANIVRGRAFERYYYQVLNRAIAGFVTPGVKEPVAEADRILSELSNVHSGCRFVPIAEAARGYGELLEERHKNPGIHGLKTGYHNVDHRLNGLKPGELVVIAARPGMGKTNYVLNILRQVALGKEAKKILGFSLEMPNSQLLERLLAAQGKIQKTLLQTGKVYEHKASIDRTFAAMKVIAGMDVLLCDSPSLTVQEICAMTRRERRRADIGMVFIDYLGLVDYSGEETRHDLKVAEITRSLKKLAREVGCPVFLLSQLSRAVEAHKDRRPMLSHLKDSGAIEADADVVQFLYRDVVYYPDSPRPDQVEIITAKCREGEVGTDYLKWCGEYALMESQSDKDKPPVESYDDFDYERQF